MAKDFSYIENGIIRLGIITDWGGVVGYLALVADSKNFIDSADKGREIQQSYYGNIPDELGDAIWSGVHWPWNPVQGGDSHNYSSQVVSWSNDGTTIYCKTLPKDWANSNITVPGYMEEWITLNGNVAVLHFRFTYKNHADDSITGLVAQAVRQHEVPAMFVSIANGNYVNLANYQGAQPWTNDSLTWAAPGSTNEYYQATEDWHAYTDDSGNGIGIYSPIAHATPGGNVTCYAEGVGVSYLAPLIVRSINPGDVIDYTCYVTIGNITDIRSRFQAIHGQLFPFSLDSDNISLPFTMLPATLAGSLPTDNLALPLGISAADLVVISAIQANGISLPFVISAADLTVIGGIQADNITIPFAIDPADLALMASAGSIRSPSGEAFTFFMATGQPLTFYRADGTAI